MATRGLTRPVMDDVEIVIPSRGRPDCQKAVALFPDPVLCVEDFEADAYAAANPGTRLLVHPNGPLGSGWKRYWIRNTVTKPVIFYMDDDVVSCACLVGQTVRRLKAPDIQLLVLRTAQVAYDVGTVCFGFAHTIDVRNFRPFAPFSFTGFVNGHAFGLIGDEYNWDPTMVTKVDIQLCLEVLRDKRILWRDMRFSFENSGWFKNRGGLADIRTSEVVKRDIETLVTRWGAVVEIEHHVRRGRGKHQSVHLNVSR